MCELAGGSGAPVQFVMTCPLIPLNPPNTLILLVEVVVEVEVETPLFNMLQQYPTLVVVVVVEKTPLSILRSYSTLQIL